MVFEIWLENLGQNISAFNLQFNVNNPDGNENYGLDSLAYFFNGASVYNQGLALEQNMIVSINQSSIFASSSDANEEYIADSSGVLLYVQGSSRGT